MSEKVEKVLEDLRDIVRLAEGSIMKMEKTVERKQEGELKQITIKFPFFFFRGVYGRRYSFVQKTVVFSLLGVG